MVSLTRSLTLQGRGSTPPAFTASLGRDLTDCQWIQQLHSYGLLKPAFLPEAEIGALRSYMRQRDRWVADAARAIQHMQQALELMNVKLTEVVADITGTTGLAIIEAILGGDRDPDRLSQLRNRRCSRSREEIARALHGHWREEHLFALAQALDHFRYLSGRIQACDQRIDAVLCPEESDDADADPNSGGDDGDAREHIARFGAECARAAHTTQCAGQAAAASALHEHKQDEEDR